MSGQNPFISNNQDPASSQLYNTLAQAQQEAAKTANMCERYLHTYREYVGPVKDVHELMREGQPPDLLSMRYAIMKAARDNEVVKANVLANQMYSLQASGSPFQR